MAFRQSIGATPDEPLLLVLPGSRQSEVERLSGPFGDAVRLLQAQRPELRVVVAAAPSVIPQVRAAVAGWPGSIHIIEGDSALWGAMRAATVALACSGTVTTQLALAGCPMVVAYRLGPLTHLVAKALIRTRYITLFNVAAGAFVAPERVQHGCNGPRLAADLERLLDDPPARLAQIAAQSRALVRMRGGIDDPIEAAVDAVVGILRRRGALAGL